MIYRRSPVADLSQGQLRGFFASGFSPKKLPSQGDTNTPLELDTIWGIYRWDGYVYCDPPVGYIALSWLRIL